MKKVQAVDPDADTAAVVRLYLFQQPLNNSGIEPEAFQMQLMGMS